MSRSSPGIRAASSAFLILIPLLMILTTAGVVLFWGFGIHRLGNENLGQNFLVLYGTPPVPGRELYGLLATAPILGLWFYAAWRLFAMFRNFLKGPVVGPETIRHLRAYARFSALAILASFLLSGVIRWALGVFDNAPLWTHLGFSITDAAMLFSSALIFVASHIIEQGYAYKKEIEEYV